MPVDAQLKDWWGNPAIDFGDIADMENKYSNNIFIGISNQPFGNVYVLFVFDEQEQEKANQWLNEFNKSMKKRGVHPYAAGVHWGMNVSHRKMEGFQGGGDYA